MLQAGKRFALGQRYVLNSPAGYGAVSRQGAKYAKGAKKAKAKVLYFLCALERRVIMGKVVRGPLSVVRCPWSVVGR